MRRFFQICHHRSLTLSMIALFLAFCSFGFLFEHSYQLRMQGARFLTGAGIMALLGLIVCTVVIINLIRDDRSGYPSFRLSLATLLRALACFPIVFLAATVMADFFKIK